MKKNYILTASVILCLLLFILLIRSHSLKSTVIIDKSKVDLPIPTLYYSDISAKKILPYTLQDNKLVLSKKKMIAFTEGFLPKDKYDFYMDILKKFATSHNITLPKYFHDFYEDEELVVISFSGELKDIYIIEKNNLRIHPLNYTKTLDLGPMYVSHIQAVNNYLIILAGEANAYNSLIYKVYLPTFDVVDAVRLSTHPSAIEGKHYTITTKGKCIFMHGKGLKVYDTLESTYKLVNLDFTVTQVINYQNSVLALGESTEHFKYALLDENYNLVATGELTPPAPNSTIVESFTTSDYLYIISYDANYHRYANYISVYKLQSNELIYTLGISPNKPYSLLGSSFSQ